jgi:hypothetical protein
LCTARNRFAEGAAGAAVEAGGGGVAAVYKAAGTHLSQGNYASSMFIVKKKYSSNI